MNRRGFMRSLGGVALGATVLAKAGAIEAKALVKSSQLKVTTDQHGDHMQTMTHDGTDLKTKLIKQVPFPTVWSSRTAFYPKSMYETNAHRMHQEALNKWLADKVDEAALKAIMRQP